MDGPSIHTKLVVFIKKNLFKVKYYLKKAYSIEIISMDRIDKSILTNDAFNHTKAMYNTLCYIRPFKNRNHCFKILYKIFLKLKIEEKAMNLVHAKKMMKKLLVEKKVLLILNDNKDQA